MGKWKKISDWILGRQITPTEMLRKNKRAITKAIRDIDRERLHMEMQEKKLICDIKKMARESQLEAVKIMARDLVKTRRYIKKFMLMKANLQAVSMSITTLQSQQAISVAMRGVTLALRAMNAQLRLPTIQLILREFEKQSEIMALKGEMMEETIEDTIAEEDDDITSDNIVAEIFDELGLQLNDQLSALPPTRNTGQSKHKVATSEAETTCSSGIDEIQARLDKLKNNFSPPSTP